MSTPQPPAAVPPVVRPATGSDGDANLDPLTNEPGAHPVGVGVGAAGAGAVGALLGSVVGPVGALLGSVVGALTGAVVGKETAETINPTDQSAAPDEPGVAGNEPLPVPPVGLLAMDAGTSEPTGHSQSAFLAAPFSPGVDSTPPPEPMAEPAPPSVASGRRLQRITLADRSTPREAPPLEVTVQSAYPEHNVREAAYLRYLERQRTGGSGSELDDWAAAEREVLRG